MQTCARTRLLLPPARSSHRILTPSHGLLTVLAVGSAFSCSPKDASVPSEGDPRAPLDEGTVVPPGVREGSASRFEFTLYLATGEVTTGAEPPPYDCAVPILLPGLDLSIEEPPESGVVVRFPGTRHAETASDGMGELRDAPAGDSRVRVDALSGKFHVDLSIHLFAASTKLRGIFAADKEDFDRDRDVAEPVLVLDLEADVDGDRVSDDRKRVRWFFAKDGGMVLSHNGRGSTQRTALGASYDEVTAGESYLDRDGDFVEDSEDADDDGNGISDIEEPYRLSCPGFSHADFYSDRSVHRDLKCETCHQASDPNALRCEDCHSQDPAIGRAFAGTPTNAPTRHFERRCEQCHVADRPWAVVPGPGGELHAAFPLQGKHVKTDCFRCHETARPKPMKECASCHSADAPPNHYGPECSTCHSSNDWSPVGSVGHHSLVQGAMPLTLGHANVACNQCHTGQGGFQSLPRACESCHQGRAPTGHAMGSCATCHASGKWIDPSAPPAGVVHPLVGGHSAKPCTTCHGASTPGVSGPGFANPRPSAQCQTCHVQSVNHIPTGATGCEGCHGVSGWLPATGGHAGTLPSASFPYAAWTGGPTRWFNPTHHSANQCSDCHTRMADPVGLTFFSCTTGCHQGLNTHGGALFFFNADARPSPPYPGGAPWPTGHVGCVKSGCHANG